MNSFLSNREFEAQQDEIINRAIYHDCVLEQITTKAEQQVVGDWRISFGDGLVNTQERKVEREIYDTEKRYWKNNFPYEVYSNYPSKNGWAMHLECDQFLFGFADVRWYAVLDWRPFKKWCEENLHLYDLKQQTRHSQKNDTRFYRIPFCEIPDEYFLVTFHLDANNEVDRIAGKDEFVAGITRRP